MKIAATVDFSIASESILRITKVYAQKLEAEVFLIHADPSNENDDAPADLRPEAVRLKKDAQALQKAGIKVMPVLAQGPVCETILEEAIRREVELIIVGAHGHGGNTCKSPVGHVSDCILMKSKIPVMVVHG
jgi:nucleotide-binding universal stress UspA family protein